MDSGEIKLQGFDRLEKALRQLPTNVEKNILRGGVRAGAVVIRDEGEKFLGKPNHMIVQLKRIRGGTVTAMIGLRASKWYVKFREFGTSLHEVTAKKKQVLAESENIMAGISEYHAATSWAVFKGTIFGKRVSVQQPAKPFLRPAFDSKKEAAMQALGSYTGKRIEQEAKKLAGG